MIPTIRTAVKGDPADNREAMWAEIDKKRAAARAQVQRAEWALIGCTRDVQRYTQPRVRVDEIIETLTTALMVAKELRDVVRATKELDHDEF